MPKAKVTTSVLLLILVTLALLPTPAPALPLPDAPGCPVFPEGNPWNQPVTGLPVHGRSPFTVSRSRRHFIYPARHYASSLTSRDLPAMGQRLRLKRSFDITRFGPQAQIVLRALKRYGMIVADNAPICTSAEHRIEVGTTTTCMISVS